MRLRSSRASTAPREMKTIRCCLSRQTMKKFIKRRLNSFKTQIRTLSENVSLNRTKIVLNRKNAIIHNKSRKLFLTERQDKQMIIEARRSITYGCINLSCHRLVIDCITHQYHRKAVLFFIKFAICLNGRTRIYKCKNIIKYNKEMIFSLNGTAFLENIGTKE